MTPIPDNATLLIVPLSPQPPEGYGTPFSCTLFVREAYGFRRGEYTLFVPVPHAPGDVIDGRTVKAVRVPVRLDHVTEADAKSAGYECRSDLAWDCDTRFGCPYEAAVKSGHRADMKREWNARYPHLPADSNPWVWLIELEPTT